MNLSSKIDNSEISNNNQNSESKILQLEFSSLCKGEASQEKQIYEFSDAKSIPTNSNLNLNFLNRIPSIERNLCMGNGSSPIKAVTAGLFISPIYEEKMLDGGRRSKIEEGGNVNKFNLELNTGKEKDEEIIQSLYPRTKLLFQEEKENTFHKSVNSIKTINTIKSSLDMRKEKVNQPVFKKQFVCRCDKSKCQKKYCECFLNGERCDPDQCKCSNCGNIHLNQNDSPKCEVSLKTYCNCTRSNCQKQYCECFKNSRECNKLCRCVNCINCQTGINKLKTNKIKHFSKMNTLEHISISIINCQITIDTFTDNILKKKTKRTSLRKKENKKKAEVNNEKSPIVLKERNPLFMTTCETANDRNNFDLKLKEDENLQIRKKLEMKKWENQTLFD